MIARPATPNHALQRTAPAVAELGVVRRFFHMRHLTFIAVTVLIVSGCSEPYPGWTVIDIRYDDLPRGVKKSFQQDFPETRISKVERSTFESRASGHPRKFRLFFEESGGSEHVIYDAAGKRADGFDFWFGRPTPNHALQRTGAAVTPVAELGVVRRR